MTALVLFTALLLGCDPVPARDLLGVSLDAQGRIEIHAVTCTEERIERVRLEGVSVEGTSSPAHQQLLWEIRSDTGGTTQTFVVGATPPGFDESAPIDQSAIDEHELLQATVNSTDGVIPLSFRLEDLEEDRVFSGLRSELRDAQEFERRAADACGRRGIDE